MVQRGDIVLVLGLQQRLHDTFRFPGFYYLLVSDRLIPVISSSKEILNSATKQTIIELLDEKESLQKQLRQANDRAAHWACKYYGEETRFHKQNRELAIMRRALSEIVNLSLNDGTLDQARQIALSGLCGM
ncbi:hypothetical protein [Paenibacillus sp. A14]|uniref:hypothetical protein n=1 Tax=Paenibacillus sp. A14 TaxID=3119820 RepID=UPI002FE0BA7F